MVQEEERLRVYAGQGRVFADMWACRREMKRYHGTYPGGFIKRVRENWIGEGEIIHICSGTVQTGEIAVDINPAQHPTVVADAQSLPFKDGSLPNVIVDPPYDELNAEAYGFPYPKPYALLKEAVRVTVPGGYIGMLHWLCLIRPKKSRGYDADCQRIAVVGITIGANMRIRCFNLFRKEYMLEDFDD